MKTGLFVLLFIASTNLVAQAINFDDCSVSPMFVTWDTPASFTSTDLKEYFNKALPKDYFKGESKKITLQILIDKQGKACCKSILNGETLNPGPLKQAVNQMPSWTPAVFRGNSINVSCITILDIEDGQLVKVKTVDESAKLNSSTPKGKVAAIDIEEALNNAATITELHLYNRGIDTLDSRVVELKNLKTLNLGKNNFESIPEEVFKLKNLTFLQVYKNQLRTIPTGITKLNYLQILTLSDNYIETFPEELSLMRQLRVIDVTGNPLKKGEMEKIKTLLPNCQVIYKH